MTDYLPTQAEIAAMCVEIQKGWTRSDFVRRRLLAGGRTVRDPRLSNLRKYVPILDRNGETEVWLLQSD